MSLIGRPIGYSQRIIVLLFFGIAIEVYRELSVVDQ